ncbi:MAG: 6,7-dimethyl-8-ribityllumazine synthase [Bacteroidia bacterium]|nr:6,7-dimethyl-8-ribityllumazine synthase [Bacteroidia bacterium]
MSGHDLSHIRYTNGKNHSDTCVSIIVSKWNPEVTEALYEGSVRVLKAAGVPDSNIIRMDVPGTFELALGAQFALEKALPYSDGAICLGCVIQGETRHFDFICSAASQGIMDTGLKFHRPVIFGVLTTDNQQQALDRAGGKYGNKGEEAAVAVLEMIDLRL